MTLAFGEIISIKETRAKIKLYDFDTIETIWVHMPQLCALKDKSFSGYEIGTQIAASINSSETDGCIIGALYNGKDAALTTDGNLKTITFEDGTNITYDKKNHLFLMDIKGNANVKAQNGIVFDCDVKITKTLQVEDNVTFDKSLSVSKNVSDSKGTMQKIREDFNSHMHSNGNNGANTGTPTSEM